MNVTIEPLLTSIENQSQAIKSLTSLGISRADKFAQLNAYASLAALDNSTHHFATLITSQDFDDLIELQIKSFLPAFESAKAYVTQLLAFSVATSRDLGHLFERKLPSL